MRVEIERCVDAAFQRFPHHEIEPVQVLDLVALDRAADEIGIGLLDTRRRERRFQQRCSFTVAMPASELCYQPASPGLAGTN